MSLDVIMKRKGCFCQALCISNAELLEFSRDTRFFTMPWR